MNDCGDEPYRWTVCERILGCAVHKSVLGLHRTCRVGRRRCVTGPREDFPVQILCLVAFGIAFAAWIALSVGLVAQTNPLLCLNPFLTLVLVSFGAITTGAKLTRSGQITQSLICYMHCAFSDPGVIPVYSKDDAQPSSQEGETLRNDPLFCRHCQFKRELGTYHCGTCNACVKELDHHCGVVGNCVGARNKASFLGVLIFPQFAFMFGLANTILAAVYVAQKGPSGLDTNTAFQSICWTIAGVELLITILPAVFILGFHFGLAHRMPFSIITRLSSSTVNRKFFEYTARRQSLRLMKRSLNGALPLDRRDDEAIGCSVVDSEVDWTKILGSTNHNAFVNDNIQISAQERKSEEAPLTSV